MSSFFRFVLVYGIITCMCGFEVASSPMIETSPKGTSAFHLKLEDPSRSSRVVESIVCMSARFVEDTKPADLFIFAHGGGLFPEDYKYLCDSLPSSVVVARLVTPTSDPPMDLRPMSKDMSFLAAAIPRHSRDNTSSPLYGRLSGRVILTGHSMGGAAAILAGADASLPESVDGVAVLAPGFWGDDQVGLLKEQGCSLTAKQFLLVVGDQDCANSLSAQALPIWHNITTACGGNKKRALAVLRGATHCQWTTPVKGTCNFDKPCSAPRLAREMQQDHGLQLFNAMIDEHLEPTLAGATWLSGHVTERSSPAEIAALHSDCPCTGSRPDERVLV